MCRWQVAPRCRAEFSQDEGGLSPWKIGTTPGSSATPPSAAPSYGWATPGASSTGPYQHRRRRYPLWDRVRCQHRRPHLERPHEHGNAWPARRTASGASDRCAASAHAVGAPAGDTNAHHDDTASTHDTCSRARSGADNACTPGHADACGPCERPSARNTGGDGGPNPHFVSVARDPLALRRCARSWPKLVLAGSHTNPGPLLKLRIQRGLRLIVQIRQRRCEVVPLVHGFLTRPASQLWSSNQASAFPPRLRIGTHQRLGQSAGSCHRSEEHTSEL